MASATQRIRRRPRGVRQSGQAMVEMIVALIVILVLFAGTLQIASLGLARSEQMNAARRQAGQDALLLVPVWSAPDYICDRDPGPDDVRYSRDDGATPGDVGAFRSRIVAYSHPDALGQQAPNNYFTALWRVASPPALFGFTHGRAERSVPLLPIVRKTLYASDAVEVEGDAWLTWMHGIY